MSATRPPAFDDRFSTPIEASRRGAHRARPKPATAGLPVAAGAAVILLVLGGGYVVLKGGNSVSDSSSNQVAANAADDDNGPTATGTKVAAPPAADTDTADKPAASATKGGGGTTVKADKSLPIKVLNSGVINGLAARKAADLNAKGWNAPTSGSAARADRGRAVSRIYYGAASAKAAALTLQKELGYGTLVLNSTVTGPKQLILLLGKDAE